MPFKNKTILSILDYYRDIWALNYASSLAQWDLETYMPVGGADAKGEAQAKIASLGQRLFLDKKFAGLVHESAGEENLSDAERGVVRVLQHDLKYYESLPPDFLEEYEKLTTTSPVVWREAKEKNDYGLFVPSLTKIFEMSKQMAEYLGYEGSPYNALLDQYEEGLTVSEVEPFFDQIRDPLKSLLARILKSDKHNNSHFLESKAYKKEKLMKLNQEILMLFRADFGRFRIDTSAHPFTSSFSRDDTRITTLYHDHDFMQTVGSTVHEFGHALYDLQSAPMLQMTPIAAGSSMILQESQSRFWENFIGKSEAFIRHFKKGFEEAVGTELSMEDLMTYFNKVAPGMIRTEADEVTYHFHVMLRYEIEKGVIDGSLKIGDLREIWNSKMQEYLGITPKNDSEGILQDMHWSDGYIGYFPTYSMGTFLSAQWNQQIQMENGKLTMENLDKTESWLAEHVHKYGSTYTFKDLLAKNGMKFDPSVNLRYLQEKYAKIYDF